MLRSRDRLRSRRPAGSSRAIFSDALPASSVLVTSPDSTSWAALESGYLFTSRSKTTLAPGFHAICLEEDAEAHEHDVALFESRGMGGHDVVLGGFEEGGVDVRAEGTGTCPTCWPSSPACAWAS